MRRAILIVLGFLAVVTAGLYLFRGQIALRAVQIGAQRAMTRDAIATLPDGLHVVLCGAGGPLPDPERSGPCVAVIADGSMYIVDAGSGGARNLLRWQLLPGHIDAVFLTHFHSDHIDGLGELALLRWTTGNHRSPLPVIGPEGVQEVVAGFNRAYAADHRFRSAHHGEKVTPSSGAGMVPRPFAPPKDRLGARVWRDGDLEVTMFGVEHAPVRPAVGYRFDYRGRSVVISGDTSKSENLAYFARNADLLVHEALDSKMIAVTEAVARETGNLPRAQIMADVPEYHTTPVEAAEVAATAGVDHLLYYHIVPPLLLPGLDVVFLEGTAEAYDGPITLGVDGTMLSLPAGSDAITVSEF
jgi:ribonuclease Z